MLLYSSVYFSEKEAERERKVVSGSSSAKNKRRKQSSSLVGTWREKVSILNKVFVQIVRSIVFDF